MAYTRENLLNRMLDVQRIYKQYSQKWDGDYTDVKIYRDYIYPTYKISRATFYDYLGTNAKKELKDLAEAKKAQGRLFE